MKQTLWKLQNEIKNYAWGSKHIFTKLFGIENLANLPQAEIWMGAHPQGVSIAVDTLGKQMMLDELIAQNPAAILGESAYKKYHNLPYLLKILSADSPLSIQVHPDIAKAKKGYEKENALSIPLDSPTRNYKDPNHKPELIYALTPFLAMNGFRKIDEIILFFEKIKIFSLQKGLEHLLKNPSEIGLKSFFCYLLTLDNSLKQVAIAELRSKIDLFEKEPFDIVKRIIKLYPNDIGIFAPLLLNVIKLEPGQAMFLKAQTPHAYLNGTGIEIMASSDNVLRAGLTNKHIDVTELLDNTNYHSIPNGKLLTKPKKDKNKIIFPVPVKDFAFEILYSQKHDLTQKVDSAEIIFCIKGQVALSTELDHFTIKAGEAAFIASSAKFFHYRGEGVLARAYSPNL